MKAATKIERLLNEASLIGYQEIEHRARKIMKDHSNITAFAMAMGSATFYDANGPMWDHKYFESFYRFLYAFDSELLLTGMPLKLTSQDGPVITDW